MTRDELVETITRTLVGNDLDTEHFAFCRRMGVDVIAAIEAAGLCIVPVEATDAIEDAMLDTGLVEDGIPRKSASDCAQTVYRAALDAGKL